LWQNKAGKEIIMTDRSKNQGTHPLNATEVAELFEDQNPTDKSLNQLFEKLESLVQAKSIEVVKRLRKEIESDIEDLYEQLKQNCRP